MLCLPTMTLSGRTSKTEFVCKSCGLTKLPTENWTKTRVSLSETDDPLTKTNENRDDPETRETKRNGKRPATTTCKPMQSKAMANSRPSIFGFFCIGRKTVNLRGWICGCSPSKRWKSDTKMIRGGPIFSMSRG